MHGNVLYYLVICSQNGERKICGKKKKKHLTIKTRCACAHVETSMSTHW